MAESEYGEVFREEASELLEEMENGLLELEKDPTDLKIVGRVFRAMHTIKGSGAMFGFEDIAGFTHHVETALDKVRDGAVPVTKALIDLTLASRDHILALLDAATGGAPADPARGEEIIASLRELVAAATGGATPAAAAVQKDEPVGGAAEVEVDDQDKSVGQRTHYRVHLKPSAEFITVGGEVDQLFDELRKLGECTVFIHEEADAAAGTYGMWEALLTTDKGINAVKDVFVFAESSCLVSVVPIASQGDEEFAEHKRLGEILVERGEIGPAALKHVLDSQKPLGELLVESKLVPRSKVEAALAEQEMRKSQKMAAQKAKTVDSIRVGSDKLDRLINLVGEMVVNQARLTQVSSQLGAADLVEPVEQIERLTAEMRDCVLNIRMLPIGTTFARFKRLVRDLSTELGKDIEMITEGAETELDKNVLDQLGDPLVHLIRNSIDHGVEPPDVREQAGKPRRGTIRLSATHSGANVLITVSDDGYGLDRDRIREKAIAKGLLRADVEASDVEIFNTIFAPGLSTATTVTSVSGRGVGMDVVKSTVEALKGSVSVTSSKKGRGTVITITLPLTLAIIDGLLVLVEDTHFVLPLSQVLECVELSSADIARFHDRRVMAVRDQLVPYVRLRDFFLIPGERPELEQMVIVRINEEQFGVVLDGVIGEHQTVLKSLGWIYRNAVGVSGSTILGNGEVALILDVPSVLRHAHVEEQSVFGETVH